MALLPPTLVLLKVWPESGPRVIALSSFQRMSKLKRLTVAFGNNQPYHYSDRHQLLLDATLNSLRVLLTFDRLYSVLAPDTTVQACLPHIFWFKVNVVCTSSGMKLVDSILAMTTLEGLGLKLSDGNAPDWTLSISNASLINALGICGPVYTPKVTLHTQKSFVKSRFENLQML